MPGGVIGAISVDAGTSTQTARRHPRSSSRLRTNVYLFENSAQHLLPSSSCSSPRGLSLVQSAIAADIDDDSDPDLVATAFSSFRLGYYENCGGQYAVDATSTAPRTLPQGGPATSSL